MKMKKIASVVAAGVMAMGIGASLAPAGVAFADSPYCGTVEKAAPENGFFFDFAKKMPQETQWDEIDIEFLGKDTTKVQFNYYVDSQGGHEYLCDLGFDASEDFHVYAFDWEPDAITWYVDGKEVHKAVGNLPVTPSMVMANLWAGKGVDAWLNPVDDSDFPVQAEYKWMKYTPSEKANK